MSDLDLLVARMKTAGALRVYKVGAVPSTPGDAYAVLSLDTGAPTNRRVQGSAGRSYLLSVACNGQSYDGVKAMADYADAAFDAQTLTDLTGSPCARRELNIGPNRDPDGGGWLYILHTYRF